MAWQSLGRECWGVSDPSMLRSRSSLGWSWWSVPRQHLPSKFWAVPLHRAQSTSKSLVNAEQKAAPSGFTFDSTGAGNTTDTGGSTGKASAGSLTNYNSQNSLEDSGKEALKSMVYPHGTQVLPPIPTSPLLQSIL